jgi:small subunit ribosomal protein S21
MPTVRIRERESFEGALRRFKRACEKAGIISDMRRHEYYEKPKWIKKRKYAQACKRWLKRLSKERIHPIRTSKEKEKQ